jgi:subtilisin family serine protease
MAAPHVAGLAALIRSAKPDLTADDIMKVIRYTADDINHATAPGRDDHAGYGRINMTKALAPYIID